MNLLNAVRFGYFENPKGYSLVKIPDSDRRRFLFFTSCDYEFTLDQDRPLTFHFPDGVRVQPDRHDKNITDMGSVPAPLQVIIPKDRFLLSFILHDSAYEERNGRHGLYISPGPEYPFEFEDLTRWEVDNLLWRTVGAENGNAFQRQAVYRSVRVGGRFSW